MKMVVIHLHSNKIISVFLILITLLLISSCNAKIVDDEKETVKYTVTYISFNDAITKEVNENEFAENIRLEKYGFEFIDWYLDEEYNNVFDFNTPIIDNITLYAKWEILYGPLI